MMIDAARTDSPTAHILTRRQVLLLSGLGFVGSIAATGCGGGGGAATVENPRVLPSPEGDAVVFSATDATNPLNIFRTPITRRLQVLALDLAQGVDSPLNIIDRFMSYIDGFAVGYASTASPDATVQERIGACGPYTGVLLALARSIGVMGRYVNLHNYPANDGHTVCELFINLKWILFDPTTHLYYSDREVDGNPLSYDEICYRYRNGLPVFRIGGNARAGRDLYSGPNIFLNANPQGVIGPDRAMIFPLRMDLVQKPVISAIDYTAANQGAPYIGAAAENVSHLWSFTGLAAGASYRFVMEPHWMGGDYSFSDADLTFVLSSELSSASYLNVPAPYWDFAGGLADPYVVEFTAAAPTVTLLVSHPYRGPAFRYVHVLEYRLEQI